MLPTGPERGIIEVWISLNSLSDCACVLPLPMWYSDGSYTELFSLNSTNLYAFCVLKLKLSSTYLTCDTVLRNLEAMFDFFLLTVSMFKTQVVGEIVQNKCFSFTLKFVRKIDMFSCNYVGIPLTVTHCRKCNSNGFINPYWVTCFSQASYNLWAKWLATAYWLSYLPIYLCFAGCTKYTE